MPIDPHIINLHEAFDLSLSDLVQITTDALTGQLKDPVEKVDGQNLTFTFDAHEMIKFIGKGCPKWTIERGGLSINEMLDHFSSKPSIALMLKEAMGALDEIAYCHKQMFTRICKKGQRYINAEVIAPSNINVIRYRQKMVCFHGLVSAEADDFKDLCRILPESAGDGWRVIAPPIPKFIRLDDAQKKIDAVEKGIDDLKRKFQITGDPSLGDVCHRIIAHRLKAECSSFLGSHKIRQAALRLLLNEAKHLGRRDFVSIDAWTKFKRLNDDRINFVGSSLIPVEGLSQLVGSFALESYEYAVAPDDPDRVAECQRTVESIRQAYHENRVSAKSHDITRIGVALARVNEKLFTRNVEGIVFTWKDQRLKLTGAFPAINRLLGYFHYGNEPARVT